MYMTTHDVLVPADRPARSNYSSPNDHHPQQRTDDPSDIDDSVDEGV
jgi:hypothetical protein